VAQTARAAGIAMAFELIEAAVLTIPRAEAVVL
jgi:hypothetical protein